MIQPADSNEAQPRSAEPRRPIPTRRKLLYASIVLVATLGLVEGSGRLWFATAGQERWSQLEGVLVAVGFESLHAILEPEATRFWKLRAGLDGVRLTGRLGRAEPIAFRVSTDDRGHRRVPPKPDAAQTVLFLGDSCTFGVGVDDEQTFAAIVQDRVPGVRSINAGVPGYTAYQGRVTLETLDPSPVPDAIVVSFMFNDALPWDGRGDLEVAAAREHLDAWLIRQSHVLRFLSSLGTRSDFEPADGTKPRPRLTDREYTDELVRMIRWARARGSEPILMAWPLARQMRNDGSTPKQRAMREVAREHDVALVDLVAAFRAQSVPMFVDAVHAGPAGHRLVARKLAPVLEAALTNSPAQRP